MSTELEAAQHALRMEEIAAQRAKLGQQAVIQQQSHADAMEAHTRNAEAGAAQHAQKMEQLTTPPAKSES